MNDQQQIQALIKKQFSSLKWDYDTNPEWQKFSKSFLDEAFLVPAKRPAEPKSVNSFIARMNMLRDEGKLNSFSEKPNSIFIKIIGNIAVAMAGCEMCENGSVFTQDISAFLLIKSENEWKIAAQGWDVVEDFSAL